MEAIKNEGGVFQAYQCRQPEKFKWNKFLAK